ncbi:cold shock domain-containing protein [Halobellus ordinarius]|uniref:cold shock domain-containing protein n=1 Tax=Halobellus ordinarius TaxID=3075120 RepID=UPI002880BAF2|nr:cold shock domain-containing protein [Halobellus sp. ZY16]
MSFRVEESRVVSDTTPVEYRVSESFHRVLNTLPDDAVPKGLVMVGVLTEQLHPIDGEAAQHVEHVEASVTTASAAVVPGQTVDAILWLLQQVSSSLSEDRKELVGDVIAATGLNERGAGALDEESRTGRTAEQAHPTVAAVANESHFACEFCAQPFEFEGQLTSHWAQCDDRPSGEYFECPNCHNKFIAEYARTQHLQSCNATPPDSTNTSTTDETDYTCSSCGEAFDSRRKLQAHEFHCATPNTESQSESTTESDVLVRDAIGTVTHYSSDGYGFISTTALADVDHPDADVSEDVFFHISEYPGHDATEGDLLTFNVIETEEGFNATEISKRQPQQQENRDDTFASTRPQWSKDT